MKAQKYDVFISYSRADYLDDNNNVISSSPIREILQAFEDKGIKFWIDVDGHHSPEYMAKITDAINSSGKVIFISSKQSNHPKSFWPIKEISLASEKHKVILPVKIDNSEFNANIELPLAGLDIIEYYKNPEQGLSKLTEMVLGEREEIKISLWRKILGVFSLLAIGIVALFLFFATFGTIGYCVGYFPNLIDKSDDNEVIKRALRDNRFSKVDNQTIKYVGETISFTYNMEKGYVVDVYTYEDSLEISNFFKPERIWMSISIPFLFDRLFMSASKIGNPRAKFGIVVGGSIGILCGYTVGEYIGESRAVTKNEKVIYEYFKYNNILKDIFKEKMELIK